MLADTEMKIILKTHLVVVVQPDPFQSNNFVGFSVFSLENCPIRTYGVDNDELNHTY